MTRSAARRPASASTPDALAREAGEALRQGRFKKAVELYKLLLRREPRSEWRERLADAYAGRARDLAAKGMYKEAAIVLENTLTAGRTIREPLLYVSCLIRQGQHQKALCAARETLAWLPAADAARLADHAAALSLVTRATAPAPSVVSPWAQHSSAARAAMQAWLQDSPAEEIERQLGRIPLRSPFGPLRLLLKSLITPPDNGGKARALLAMIPAESAFAGPRAAAEAALADDRDLLEHWPRLRPAQRQFVAERRGLAQSATTLLDQLLDAESRGSAALFGFLLRRDLAFADADIRAACRALLPSVPSRLPDFETRFGELAALERSRLLALAAEAQGDWRSVARSWHAVIEALAREGAADARLGQAVIYRHLAELARRQPDRWADSQVAEADDPVAVYLERSLDADPEFLPATLELLERYRAADDRQNWQRAAEAAAHRFPAHAAVLMHAVDAAVARKAFKTAATFARQVLQVDPINQPVRQRMIELQLAYARRRMRAGRPDLADRALAEAADWERPDQPHGALRIGRALVRLAAAPAAEAGALLRDAVQDAGGGPVVWFQLLIEASLMGVPRQQLEPVQADLAAAQKSEPDRVTVLALVGLLGQKEVRDARKTIAPVLRQINRFLNKGSGISWTSAEFRVIAAALADLHEFAVLLNYALAALRRSDDPAAHFYRIVARTGGKRNRLSMLEEFELSDMLEQMAQREDLSLFNRVQSFLMGPEAGKARRGMPRGGAMPMALDDDEMAELLDSLARAMPILPPSEVRAMVNELGHDRAIATLAGEFAGSPLGDVLSPEQLTALCAAMVADALEGRASPSRSRRRR